MTEDEPTPSEDISKEQLKNAGVDINTIDDLSKADLVKLLSDAVDDSSDSPPDGKIMKKTTGYNAFLPQ
jgi:hypothetical protein